MRENQNSSSPNSRTATKLSMVKIANEVNAGIQTGKSGYQNCMYPPITITSAIAVIIQLHQYDQPRKKPAHGPK
ncbi:hypothetical protein D3C80_789250 [compost metagenome]